MRNIWGCVIVLRIGEKKKFYKKKGNKRGKDYLQTNPKEPMVGGKG
jgi:hypothetical protein